MSRTLLAFLAVAPAGTAALEDVVSCLWPDATTAAGGARLRTVLHELRSNAGDVVVRSDRGLALAPTVSVDAHDFERVGGRALAIERQGGSEPAALTAAALASYRGLLLPGYPYEEWAVGPRERLERLHRRLLDLGGRLRPEAPAVP